MTKNMKLTALLAASTLVLAACGGTDIETADAEYDYEENAAETALSEEQPPLEGDSPAVGETDYADATASQDTYGADLGTPGTMGEYETAAVGETYELNIDGVEEPRVLMLDPATQTATLDGDAYEVAMDGERFSFDAPTTIDGEEQLMTYSGLYRDGMIEEGLIEAQGDGSSMSFSATPVENELGEAYGDVRRGVDDAAAAGESAIDNAGDELNAAGEEIEAAGENAYDRATDGSDATEALDPVDED